MLRSTPTMTTIATVHTEKHTMMMTMTITIVTTIIATNITGMNITKHVSAHPARQRKVTAEPSNTLKQHTNLRDGSLGGRFIY